MVEEKRAADRWQPPQESRGIIMCNGIKEDARILDVSNSGMRVLFNKQVRQGSEVYAKVIIVENALPYYAVGEIKRVQDAGNGAWEASIQFSQVRQEPIRRDITI